MKQKNIYILSLEAKDIYNLENISPLNTKGYNIRNKDGSINLKKFKNSFDYSLEQIELKEIYRKKYRNNKFSFFVKGKEYTQQVINVNFSYSYNLFNKITKNIYVRAGYFYKDLVFTDGVCILDNELVGIEINKKIKNPIDKTFLVDFFEIEEIQENDKTYYKYSDIKRNRTIENSANIRKHLYEKGFVCDGIKYVRYKRSSGSSRVGKCLFINEELYDAIHKWELCGLNIKDGDEIDLAAFEAYIALTTSSIIDTLQIKPENILLIDDYTSRFEEDVIGITYQRCLQAEEKSIFSENCLFDGQSLLDVELFKNYKTKGMLLLRNRFFKSACFNTNIQKWFKDNDITDVSQLNGYTRAKNIEDIKLITTPSSIKYLKFGSYDKWLDNIDDTFGIVKYEKPPHFFNGRLVQTHYQLINTLQLSKSDIGKLLEDSFNYISLIDNDVSVLKYHIHYPKVNKKASGMKNKNEVVFKLLGINEDFCKTKIFYDFKEKIIESLLKDLRQGHILVNGNYSTLFGNGVEMLQHSIGTFHGEPVIDIGCISSKRFEYDKILLGSRSPHVVAGNILLAKNVKNEMIDKYFNLSKEIVYINAIGTNILQKLSGADYDSDTLLLTDNEILIQKAQKNYDKFKTPICCVEAKKTKRVYTNADKADLDIRTAVNKIGENVNCSQYLNSILWNNIIGKGQSLEDNLELYYDACKLSVLSGIEIDKSKKEFEVNTKREIDLLKNKYQIVNNEKIVKPMFFKNITCDNGYKLSKNHKYIYFDTPMDYVQWHIKEFKKQLKNKKQEFEGFSILVKKLEQKYSRNDYKKRDKVLSILENTKKEIAMLFSSSDKNFETHLEYEHLKNICAEQINKIADTEYSIYILLKILEDNNYKNIHKLLFYSLFSLPNKKLFEMIVEKENNSGELVECNDGDIKLYDFKFKIVKDEKFL